MDRLHDFLIGEDLAPGLLEAHQFRPVPAAHFAEALAEVTVHEDREFRPRFDEVRYGGLHAGAARPRKHQREFVARAPAPLQRAPDLFVDLEEVGVEVADDRLRHGRINARVHGGGARAEQQPRRGLDIANW